MSTNPKPPSYRGHKLVDYRGHTLREQPIRGGISFDEVRKEFGLSPETIWKLIDAREIAAGRGYLDRRGVARRVTVSRCRLRRLIEAKREKPTRNPDAAVDPPEDGVPINELARELEVSGATMRRWLKEPHPALGRPIRSGIGPYVTAMSDGRKRRWRGLLVSRADATACAEATKEPCWRQYFQGPGVPYPGVWKAAGIFEHKSDGECYTERYVYANRREFGVGKTTLRRHFNRGRVKYHDVGWPGGRGEKWVVRVYTKASLEGLKARRRGWENGGRWLAHGETWMDAKVWYSARLVAREVGRPVKGHTLKVYLTRKLGKEPRSKKVPLGDMHHRGGRTLVYLHDDVCPLLGVDVQAIGITSTAEAAPSPEVVAGAPKERGRPPSPNKERIRARVLELRAKGEGWQAVYPVINSEFGTDYEYSRSGTLQKLAHGLR